MNALPDRKLAARPHQRFPSVRLDLLGKQHLDAAREMFPLGGFEGAWEWTPARCPNSRAGITRALFRTSSSSPRRRSGNSEKEVFDRADFARSRASSREESRWERGRWAISSGGRA